MDMKDLFERLLILRSPGVGPVAYNKLLDRFGSVSVVADYLNASSDLRDSVMREIELAQQLNIKFITEDDSWYPLTLKQMKNHPPVISVRGNLETLSCKEFVSLVGTRHATGVGMRFVSDIAKSFAEHGIPVVSGMAMGTDAAAHNGALQAYGNTNTVAVLAGGVDYIWPLENENLYHEILERGAVISDMPVGFVPKATNFVQRNRLVAGLGNRLILSEADLNSGSMKTVQFAVQYGKQIYAIPSHPADLRAQGPNSLIRSGAAILCQGASDFFYDGSDAKIKEKKCESENIILDKIGSVPVSESVLADIVGKNISEIKQELVMLELQGKIRKNDLGYVRV